MNQAKRCADGLIVSAAIHPREDQLAAQQIRIM
jgi:hypothetical protein